MRYGSFHPPFRSAVNDIFPPLDAAFRLFGTSTSLLLQFTRLLIVIRVENLLINIYIY